MGATGALTSIMGHLAMTKQKVITWDELGVQFKRLQVQPVQMARVQLERLV